MEALKRDLPKYCRNGVFFFDLVDRLGGREQLLKGCDRSAKKLA